MTRLFNEFLDEVKDLPADEQDEIARAGMAALEKVLTNRTDSPSRAVDIEARLKQLRELKDWIEKNRSGVPYVDDSRDSIYENTVDNTR